MNIDNKLSSFLGGELNLKRGSEKEKGEEEGRRKRKPQIQHGQCPSPERGQRDKEEQKKLTQDSFRRRRKNKKKQKTNNTKKTRG